jgi:hypothetical protein
METSVFAGPGFLAGLVLGVLIGWVSLWSYLNPAVGKTVARICAVIVIGIGVQWLVTPIYDQLREVENPHYYSPFGTGGYGPALGWGAGCLVVGITFLVLSFLRTGATGITPKEDVKQPS